MQVSWLLPSASRKPIRGWKALVSAIRETTSSIATFHPHSSMLRRTKDFWGCQTRGSSNSWPLRLQSCIQLRVRIYYISRHFWWFLNTLKINVTRYARNFVTVKGKVWKYYHTLSLIQEFEDPNLKHFISVSSNMMASPQTSLSGGHFHEKTGFTKINF